MGDQDRPASQQSERQPRQSTRGPRMTTMSQPGYRNTSPSAAGANGITALIPPIRSMRPQRTHRMDPPPPPNTPVVSIAPIRRMAPQRGTTGRPAPAEPLLTRPTGKSQRTRAYVTSQTSLFPLFAGRHDEDRAFEYMVPVPKDITFLPPISGAPPKADEYSPKKRKAQIAGTQNATPKEFVFVAPITGPPPPKRAEASYLPRFPSKEIEETVPGDEFEDNMGPGDASDTATLASVNNSSAQQQGFDALPFAGYEQAAGVMENVSLEQQSLNDAFIANNPQKRQVIHTRGNVDDGEKMYRPAPRTSATPTKPPRGFDSSQQTGSLELVASAGVNTFGDITAMYVELPRPAPVHQQLFMGPGVPFIPFAPVDESPLHRSRFMPGDLLHKQPIAAKAPEFYNTMSVHRDSEAITAAEEMRRYQWPVINQIIRREPLSDSELRFDTRAASGEKKRNFDSINDAFHCTDLPDTQTSGSDVEMHAKNASLREHNKIARYSHEPFHHNTSQAACFNSPDGMAKYGDDEAASALLHMCGNVQSSSVVNDPQPYLSKEEEVKYDSLPLKFIDYLPGVEPVKFTVGEMKKPTVEIPFNQEDAKVFLVKLLSATKYERGHAKLATPEETILFRELTHEATGWLMTDAATNAPGLVGQAYAFELWVAAKEMNSNRFLLQTVPHFIWHALSLWVQVFDGKKLTWAWFTRVQEVFYKGIIGLYNGLVYGSYMVVNEMALKKVGDEEDVKMEE